MIELLRQITAWLGYLERPDVLFQLIPLLLAVVAYGRSTRWRQAHPQRRSTFRLALLGGLGLWVVGLALLGRPHQLVVVLTALSAGWFALSLLTHFLRRFIPPRQLRDLNSGLVRPLYLLGAALILVEEFGSVQNLALIPLGSWFGNEVTLGQIFLALVVVYILLVGSGPPSAGVAWLVQRLIGSSDSGRRALALVLRYTVVALGILWALDQIGLNRTGILTVAGGLSVGLGFGVKEVFSNFISGLWLLFEGSVRPGDILFIEGDPCEVRSLGLRASVLWRNRDNAELVVPNQTFFTTTTTTYTGSDRMRRGEVLIGAAYRHDPAEVGRVLEQTAAQVAGVLRDPPPAALVLSYGDSAIQYSLRFWVEDPLMALSICSKVNTAVWHAFRDRGIEIPFPQRVVHPQARPERKPGRARERSRRTE